MERFVWSNDAVMYQEGERYEELLVYAQDHHTVQKLSPNCILAEGENGQLYISEILTSYDCKG